MTPLLEALKEIEALDAKMIAQKQRVLAVAKTSPFHILLVKALELSTSISTDRRLYDGYFDPSHGYILGFKDCLEILVNSVYPPYGQGPYPYGNINLTLAQILETISKNIVATEYISKGDMIIIDKALITIASHSAEVAVDVVLDPRSRNKEHTYRY